MAWLDVIWYCGERLFLFYPGNEYFNPYSKGWLEFCNCRECFDFGDFWCGFLVSVEENSGYTEINARLSLAQELGIHCWTECCSSNPVLKSIGKTGACLSSYCHGCERPFQVLDGCCVHWALLNLAQTPLPCFLELSSWFTAQHAGVAGLWNSLFKQKCFW